MLEPHKCPHRLNRLGMASESVREDVVICKDCLSRFSLQFLLRSPIGDTAPRMADLTRALSGMRLALDTPLADWLPRGTKPEHCRANDEGIQPVEEKEPTYRVPGRA